MVSFGSNKNNTNIFINFKLSVKHFTSLVNELLMGCVLD